jgi:hypothetical protein
MNSCVEGVITLIATNGLDRRVKFAAPEENGSCSYRSALFLAVDGNLCNTDDYMKEQTFPLSALAVVR